MDRVIHRLNNQGLAPFSTTIKVAVTRSAVFLIDLSLFDLVLVFQRVLDCFNKLLVYRIVPHLVRCQKNSNLFPRPLIPALLSLASSEHADPNGGHDQK